MAATVDRVRLDSLLYLLKDFDPKLHSLLTVSRNYLLVVDDTTDRVAAIVQLAGESTQVIVPDEGFEDIELSRVAMESEIVAMKVPLDDGQTELDIRLDSLAASLTTYTTELIASQVEAADAADTTKS